MAPKKIDEKQSVEDQVALSLAGFLDRKGAEKKEADLVRTDEIKEPNRREGSQKRGRAEKPAIEVEVSDGESQDEHPRPSKTKKTDAESESEDEIVPYQDALRGHCKDKQWKAFRVAPQREKTYAQHVKSGALCRHVKDFLLKKGLPTDQDSPYYVSTPGGMTWGIPWDSAEELKAYLGKKLGISFDTLKPCKDIRARHGGDALRVAPKDNSTISNVTTNKVYNSTSSDAARNAASASSSLGQPAQARPVPMQAPPPFVELETYIRSEFSRDFIEQCDMRELKAQFLHIGNGNYSKEQGKFYALKSELERCRRLIIEKPHTVVNDA